MLITERGGRLALIGVAMVGMRLHVVYHLNRSRDLFLKYVKSRCDPIVTWATEERYCSA